MPRVGGRLMRKIILTIVVVGGCAWAVVQVRDQFRPRPAAPTPVSAGDVEIAWIHTTTNPQTWERFVAGVHEAGRQVPGMVVDDARAFLDQTADVPEVAVSMMGRPGKLRFRWYKLSGEVSTRDWVQALAGRDPPPLGFMGGGSSDRAIELARALAERTEWLGQRPLLLITTATADEVYNEDLSRGERLVDVYPNRTFRFCFTNAAMARAVVDFVWQADDLRPRGPVAGPAVLAHLGGLNVWNLVAAVPAIRAEGTARAYVLAWQDDPYSVDLAEQFHRLFHEGDGGRPERALAELRKIPYSVGTFNRVNPREVGIAEEILADAAPQPGQRMLLVLPAATQPARRMIRAFAADSPLVGRHLVAVTGDGVSFNTLYRDGDIAWPMRELSIPLVFFAHQNPVAWDEDGTGALRPPNSTDDVLLFADMARALAGAVLAADPAVDAEALANRLHAVTPAVFDRDGERLAGSGEYVVIARPQFDGDRVTREAVIEVYARKDGRRWSLVRRLIK